MAAGNSVNDEIREQHQKMKGKSRKEKFAYFWEYYKVHTLVAILVLILGGSMIYSIATQKDIIMEAAFVNTYLSNALEMDTGTEEMASEFIAFSGADAKKEAAVISTMSISYESSDEMSFANIQKLMAMVAARTIDAIVANEDYIDHALETGLFTDLRTCLSEEQFEELESRGMLLYKDLGDDDTDEKIPVAIDVRSSKYMLSDEVPAWLIVVSNSKHPDKALEFMEFMLTE